MTIEQEEQAERDLKIMQALGFKMEMNLCPDCHEDSPNPPDESCPNCQGRERNEYETKNQAI